MKDKFINNVMQKMQTSLNNKQMQQLETILNFELSNLLNEHQEVDKNDDEIVGLFIDAKKLEGCSHNTMKYYISTIDLLLKHLNKPINEIDTKDLRNYLSTYQEQRNSTKTTIDNIRRILSSFFSWLEDENYIIKSPVRRIKKVKTPITIKETYSDEELEIMRDNVDNSRDLAMIDMLASTGMRVGELVKLNIEDIDFNERECIVLGKGNKQRIVYFDARTKIHLKNYLNSRNDQNKALFVTLKAPYNRISISGVESKLRKIGEKLNIKKVHPHKFRRTLATIAIDKGMPIEQVQRLLGHEKVDTTLKYAMVKQNNVKLAHQKYIG
ncbi:site-specific tyrosine recombinase/integron integrase [Ureaplasma diversum]|uniref:Phage integrase family protein n=1 Tax=Ureaplasma diversum NCTC 246 TaxID=1188241 RepID=A0A084F1L9_9BACT|nr:site-specific tyrosine recombinase/integron integrase [Ureaplasma diversum]KEZ24111.1 Phage integrase family protein [Ureaplasma diversum NCTC 246]